ncbi:MAG: SPOR domain-containing protein [Leptothrix sp. (in: b-proteobacteria)]
MLRALVLLLLVANLVFFSWTRGWLAGPPLGLDPEGDREPQRLHAQVHPDVLQLLSLSSLVAPAVPVCLDAGPFSPAEQPQVSAVAQANLPEGSWALLPRDKPGSWMVYMGRFPNREFMQRKGDELKRLGVRFEELKYFAELEPGFVLGRYSQEDAAKAALQALTGQRIRSARIVTVAPASISYTLHIGQADAALQTTALGLRDQLGGKTFVACPKETAGGPQNAASQP